MIEHGFTNEKYQASEWLSASQLVLLGESPAEFHATRTGEYRRKRSDAMDFGTAVHAAVFERTAFSSDYAVMPSFENDAANRTKAGDLPKSPRATAYYKSAVEEWTQWNLSKSVLTMEEYLAISSLRCGVDDHLRSVGIDIENSGHCEASIFVESPSGLKLKCRPDWHCAHENLCIFIDLKTCEDARKTPFARDCGKYGYPIKLEFYRRVLELEYGVPAHGYLVAASNTMNGGFPAIRLWGFDQQTTSAAERRVDALLADYVRRMETGDWTEEGQLNSGEISCFVK
jgi:exodeoxyribonuclease VIII